METDANSMHDLKNDFVSLEQFLFDLENAIKELGRLGQLAQEGRQLVNKIEKHYWNAVEKVRSNNGEG